MTSSRTCHQSHHASSAKIKYEITVIKSIINSIWALAGCWNEHTCDCGPSNITWSTAWSASRDWLNSSAKYCRVLTAVCLYRPSAVSILLWHISSNSRAVKTSQNKIKTTNTRRSCATWSEVWMEDYEDDGYDKRQVSKIHIKDSICVALNCQWILSGVADCSAWLESRIV